MARSCGTYPIALLARTERIVIGSPATVTAPPSRSSRPAIIEIVVVFPAPFGPSSPYVSPAPIPNPTPSTATISPKRRRRPRHSSTRSLAIAPPGRDRP